MTKDISKDTDRAYLKGQIFTVEELKKRFSLAITINNSDIVEFLLNAERPLTTKNIGEKLSIKKSEPINARIRKLFKDGLVVRFNLGGNHFGYLLSEKGWKAYKESLILKKQK